jgi:hypothetical protein
MTSGRAVQALAGPNPEVGDILIATSTPNNVAVLRTLPEVPVAASAQNGSAPSFQFADDPPRTVLMWRE